MDKNYCRRAFRRSHTRYKKRLDHGVELPGEREAAGKNAEGAITMNAYINDGFTFIEVADDGGGMDLEKICAKALERGLTTFEKLEKMSDEEKYGIVSLPGFSARETVSEISAVNITDALVADCFESPIFTDVFRFTAPWRTWRTLIIKTGRNVKPERHKTGPQAGAGI